jgi:hypothetical protein
VKCETSYSANIIRKENIHNNVEGIFAGVAALHYSIVKAIRCHLCSN